MVIANQIYVQNGRQLRKEFKEVAEQKYACGVESIDFEKSTEAAQTINRFVEEKTNGTIKGIAEAEMFDEDTRVVLINAIYLKARWEFVFPTSKSIQSGLYNNETDIVPLDFMNNEQNYQFGVLDDLNASAVSLNYYKSNFTFTIILPNKITGLSALETTLKNYDFMKVINQMHLTKILVAIPKFKVESEFKMNDILKKVCSMGTINCSKLLIWKFV